MSIFDIWDSATNTQLVRRTVDAALGGQDRIAPQFAPIIDIKRDRVKRKRMELRAVGKGSFIARDATPPIFRPRVRLVEDMIELARLEEMTPIEESLLRKLKMEGSDEETIEEKARAGGEILLRAKALQIRNENLSDWMVFQALTTGKVPVEMADEPGQQYEVDFDFMPTHFPSVQTSWDNYTSGKPVTDLRAWQNLLADDAGEFGIHIWMTSDVWKHLLLSKEVKDYLTGTDRPMYIPTKDDFVKLLEEPDRVQIHVTDSGWLDEGAGFSPHTRTHLTKWLPRDSIVMTTSDPFRGERLMEVFNGLTAIQTDWNKIDHRPGPLSETLIKGESKTTFIRQACMRMVRVNLPENILTAKVILP